MVRAGVSPQRPMNSCRLGYVEAEVPCLANCNSRSRPSKHGPRTHRRCQKHRDAANPVLLEKLKASTPAEVGVGRSGFRYRTETLLFFLQRFAVAKAAVESVVPDGWARQEGWLEVQSLAQDPEQFLTRPDLGRQLSKHGEQAIEQSCEKDIDVQLVVADGLSANAVMLNAPIMVRTLQGELQRRGLRTGTPVFCRYSRSRLVDIIGQKTRAKVGLILIGERPGLGTGDGMSTYLVWQPSVDRTDAEKQAISNIHARGMKPEEAGVHAANVLEQIIAQQTSGVNLDLTML